MRKQQTFCTSHSCQNARKRLHDKMIGAQPRVNYCKKAAINDGVIVLLSMLTKTITERLIRILTYKPKIIFITDFAKYAIEGFKLK